MKINFQQLPLQLKKPTYPLYLITGDETCLVEEASSLVRKMLQQRGFDERLVYQADKSFNWQQFAGSINSMSLFSTKSLLELRLSLDKISNDAKEVLKRYVTNPPEDKILLLITNKLDKRIQNAKWFKEIESAGLCVMVWPVMLDQFPQWISGRLAKFNMSAEPSAIKFVSERVEGNLLAAKQEVEKLYLLFGEKRLVLEDVMYAATNSSRYSVFDLADSALAGNTLRTLRIINELKGEGVEPVLVLWVLAKEIRSLVMITEEVSKGQYLETVLRDQLVWEKRKPLVRASVQRHKFDGLLRLLQRSGEVDRVIKGRARGDVWDQLTDLALKISGRGN